MRRYDSNLENALLGFAREPFEVIKHGRNQLLSPGVFCNRAIGKEIKQIARFLGSLVPARGRRRDEMRFQFLLPKAQRSFIGLHFSQHPT